MSSESPNMARIKRAAFATVAALSAAACGTVDDRREGFARNCIDRGNNPHDCIDAAERLFPRAGATA